MTIQLSNAYEKIKEYASKKKNLTLEDTDYDEKIINSLFRIETVDRLQYVEKSLGNQQVLNEAVSINIKSIKPYY